MNYNTVYTNEDTYSYNESPGFLGENYVWIAIVLVVILMTIIGYIADKKKLIKPMKTKTQDNDNKVSENIKKVNDVMDVIENEKANESVALETDNNPIVENTILSSIDEIYDNTSKEDLDNDIEVTKTPVVDEKLEKIEDISMPENLSYEEMFDQLSESSNVTEEKEDLLTELEHNDEEQEEAEDFLTKIEYNDENVEETEDFASKIEYDNEEKAELEDLISKLEYNDDSIDSEELPNKVDTSIDEIYNLSDENEELENRDFNFFDDFEEKDDENVVDIELPDIDSIKTEDDQDDFWKF